MGSLLRDALKAEAARLPLTVDPEQILERGRTRQGAPRSLGLDFPRLMAAAAIGIVLMVGVVTLGVYFDRSGFGVTPSPTPSPSPAHALVPTVEPTAIQSGLPTSSPAPTAGLLEPPHTHETIAGGPGYVAVGAYDPLDHEADIWTSPDGHTWTRVPSEQLGPGVVNDVTIGGPGLVAVGRGVRTGYHAAVWTSTDGLTWSRQTDGPDFDIASMAAVTAGGPGIVAVGSFNRAWFSTDGFAWSLATVPPVPPGTWPGVDGRTPQIFMTDVAAAGGRLVALGENWYTERPVIWTSADGMAWTGVTVDPEVFLPGSVVWKLTGGAEGFTLTGWDADQHPLTWTSANGNRWVAVP
jgi:hypothetical protein